MTYNFSSSKLLVMDGIMRFQIRVVENMDWLDEDCCNKLARRA